MLYSPKVQASRAPKCNIKCQKDWQITKTLISTGRINGNQLLLILSKKVYLTYKHKYMHNYSDGRKISGVQEPAAKIIGGSSIPTLNLRAGG